MILDFEPGDKVYNPKNKDWGIGQVQSVDGARITVNFENAGKHLINGDVVDLVTVRKDELDG